MVNCVAVGCNSRSESKIPGVTFHRFPRDEVKRNRWLKHMKIAHWVPSESNRVCSAHFEERFFYRTDSKVRLLDEAVPTIFHQPPSYFHTEKDSIRAYSDASEPFPSTSRNGVDSTLAANTERLRIRDSDNMVIDVEEDDYTPKALTSEVTVKRIAKKSTALPAAQLRQSPMITTRRQVALANSIKKNVFGDRFMENFDPESSARERRKLTRKIAPIVTTTRKIQGGIYDENGVHIATGIDLCDCLQRQCPGCHFPCSKCKSTKCGPECRCNRKFTYEQIEYQGCDLTIKNSLGK